MNSVPRHCVPSEISTAMCDGTESRSTISLDVVDTPVLLDMTQPHINLKICIKDFSDY